MTESPRSQRAAERYLSWFIRDQQWSRGALPMAIVLGLIGPIVRPALGRYRFLIFLHTPVYMLHQFEEHGHGAFKAFVARAFPRARGLTDVNLCIVNVSVWAINLGALYLASFDRLALSLLAPYIAVVNGTLHLGEALRERRYNPGLWTGVLLLLPLSGITLVRVARAGKATRGNHIKGAGGAVLLHALTIVLIMFGGKKRAV